MQVIWGDAAQDDLASITEYVANHNPVAAAKLKEHLLEQGDILSHHPHAFRLGRVPGTRELVAHPNYILIYRILSDHVEIDSVLHARLPYP